MNEHGPGIGRAATSREALVEEGVLVLLTGVAVLPFWIGPLILSVDLPQHLAVAAIAAAIDDPARHLADRYLVDLWPRPYVLTTYVLEALGAVMSLATAARVALSAYAVLLVVAVRALVQSASERDRRLAWFAPLFVSSWPVAYGFLPFVFALPAVLGGVAVARALFDRPRRARVVGLALLHAVALSFHPLASMMLLIATAPIFLLAEGRARRGLGVATAAGLALVLLLALAGQLRASAPAPARFVDAEIENRWRPGIRHKVLEYALAYFPGNVDHALVVPGALALAAALVLGVVRARRRSVAVGAALDPVEWSALALFLAYILAPADLAFGTFRISILGPRFVVPIWLLGIAAPRGRVPLALLALGVASGLAFNVWVTLATRDFGARFGPEVERAVRAVPAGAAVLPEVAAPSTPVLNPHVVSTPELSLHAYVMLGGAGYDPIIFSTRQSPVVIQARAPTVGERDRFDYRWVQDASGRVAVEP